MVPRTCLLHPPVQPLQYLKVPAAFAEVMHSPRSLGAAWASPLCITSHRWRVQAWQRSTRLSNDSAASPAAVIPTAGGGAAVMGRLRQQAARDRQGPRDRQAVAREEAAVGISSNGKV